MSSYRPARFTGRVRLQSGAAAFGCRVLLRVGETPHVAAETWTSSKGEFVLEVPPGRMPTGEEAQGGFTLEVYDGTGSMLVRRGDLVARTGLVTHIAFTSPKRAMVTLPVALPLLRGQASSIVRPEALAVIDAALGLLAPVGTDAHARYARAARRTLPPSGHIDELIDLAWSALDGDPRAMDDLREVLAVQAAAVRADLPLAPAVRSDDEPRRRSKYAFGVPKEVAPTGPKVDPATVTGRLLSSLPAHRMDDELEPARNTFETAVATDRILPLLVATVRIARTSGERVAFFDGLHGLLSGLSTLDRLYRAALEVLQDRRIAPLRAQLALLQGDTGDETGLMPMPSGVRSPGADPALPELVGPWWERLQHAVRETRLALQPQPDSEEPTYEITDIDPVEAGPGAEVTIRGRGFGSHGGEVVFDGAAPVEASAWSDTELRVEVPPSARPGPVTLRVLQGVVRIGRKLVEIYREGNVYRFEGGHPQIRSVLVDGHAEGSWVRPGEAVALSWMTVAGANGRVDVRVTFHDPSDPADRALVLFDEQDLPPSGSRILAVPDVDQEHELRAEIAAGNAVTTVRRTVVFPVAIRPKLRIEGIEVTQGVQLAPWDRRYADDPVPTVAGKDTLARVYVSADREGFHDDRARLEHAVLRVGDVALRPLEVLDPETGRAIEVFEAGRPHAIDRSRTDHALVFRIPAPLCQGTRELHVEVEGAGRPPDVPAAEARLTWTWQTVRPLPVRTVRLEAAGVGPDDATVRTTALRAFDLLPTPPDDVGPAWLAQHEAPATTADLDDAAWSKVLDDLADAHDPAAWEWLRATVGEQGRGEEALWLGVTATGALDRAAPGRLTAIAPRFRRDEGPEAPTRVSAARALARVLEGPGEAPHGRVAEVPFDPYYVTTVLDPHHGVRDLAAPPTRAWIGSARWRKLLERA